MRILEWSKRRTGTSGANGFENVRVMWGVVGAETTAKTDAFFLHPDDAGSSRFPKSPSAHITRNRWQRIEVPSLSLDTAWRSHFDDLPCDLLKIDIEGSEASFVEKEANFLRSVRMLVVEIHHWLFRHTILREHWRPSDFGAPRYWPHRMRPMSDFILTGLGPVRRSTAIL